MPVTRVAIAGLGAIGRVLARKLADGMPGLALACAAARDHAKAQAWLDAERIACPLVELRGISRACRPRGRMRAGRGARAHLPADAGGRQAGDGAHRRRAAAAARADRARKAQGGQIIVPTGALLGLDAVTAAAEGRIHSVRMTTRKPPSGLAGAPYLEANGISVEGLNAPKRVFAGTAREAAAGLSRQRQRGGGAVARRHRPRPHHDGDLGRPLVDRNCHTIEVDSDSARFTLSIENVPSENPKTGRITASRSSRRCASSTRPAASWT